MPEAQHETYHACLTLGETKRESTGALTWPPDPSIEVKESHRIQIETAIGYM